MISTLPPSLVIAACALATTVPTSLSDDPARIVFVRGGLFTTGHISGSGLDSLSSIFNVLTTQGNHGYSQLAAALAADGYAVDEIAEGDLSTPGPADLLGAFGSADVLAFTSNNVVYGASDAEALRTWVCEGGGALFSSDGDWGLDWGEAPSSDQSLLAAFDLVMNQDKGTYVLSRAAGDFVVGGVDTGGHPILAGPDGIVGTADDVDAFDGEGVSPLTVTSNVPGVTPVILANAKLDKRLNDSTSLGTTVPITPDDAALVVVEYGAGRVVGHYDRNTFHNENGAGTDITELDNERYARNLFAWLVGAPGTAYGDGCSPTTDAPSLALHGCPRSGELITLDVSGATPGELAFVVAGFAPADVPLATGCSLLVSIDLPVLPAVPVAGDGTVTLSTVVPPGAEGVEAFVQVWTTEGSLAASTNGVRIGFF